MESPHGKFYSNEISENYLHRPWCIIELTKAFRNILGIDIHLQLLGIQKAWEQLSVREIFHIKGDAK